MCHVLSRKARRETLFHGRRVLLFSIFLFVKLKTMLLFDWRVVELVMRRKFLQLELARQDDGFCLTRPSTLVTYF